MENIFGKDLTKLLVQFFVENPVKNTISLLSSIFEKYSSNILVPFSLGGLINSTNTSSIKNNLINLTTVITANLSANISSSVVNPMIENNFKQYTNIYVDKLVIINNKSTRDTQRSNVKTRASDNNEPDDIQPDDIQQSDNIQQQSEIVQQTNTQQTNIQQTNIQQTKIQQSSNKQSEKSFFSNNLYTDQPMNVTTISNNDDDDIPSDNVVSHECYNDDAFIIKIEKKKKIARELYILLLTELVPNILIIILIPFQFFKINRRISKYIITSLILYILITYNLYNTCNSSIINTLNSKIPIFIKDNCISINTIIKKGFYTLLIFIIYMIVYDLSKNKQVNTGEILVLTMLIYSLSQFFTQILDNTDTIGNMLLEINNFE